MHVLGDKTPMFFVTRANGLPRTVDFPHMCGRTCIDLCFKPFVFMKMRFSCGFMCFYAFFLYAYVKGEFTLVFMSFTLFDYDKKGEKWFLWMDFDEFSCFIHNYAKYCLLCCMN